MLGFRKQKTELKPEVPAKSEGKLARSQYKEVWNSISGTQDEAKMAVSGYTDENEYRTSGEGTRAMLVNNVQLGKNDVVLEIGCGVGRCGVQVAPLCKEWIGVDVSENMLRHTRERLKDFTNFRTVASNGYDLRDIESGSVDLVYCTVVFMHLDEWERYSYIKEGMRVLRPGGRMIVDNVDLTTDLGWSFFEEHCRLAPADRPPNISRMSTPDELRTYFTRAGFEKQEVRRWAQWVVIWGYKPTA